VVGRARRTPGSQRWTRRVRYGTRRRGRSDWRKRLGVSAELLQKQPYLLLIGSSLKLPNVRGKLDFARETNTPSARRDD
jgi:hypothetical protein